MMKKIIACILCVICVCSIFSVPAKGEEFDEATLDYIYIEKKEISLHQEQHIVVSLRGISENVEEAFLYCRVEEQEEIQMPMTQMLGQTLLFSFCVEKSGDYIPVRVEYKSGNVLYTLDLAEEVDIDLLEYQVKDEQDVLEEESDISEQGIDYEIGCLKGIESTSLVGNQNKTVIVLDPGHDNRHTGAQGNGLHEEDVTLSIAKYCKEELERYRDVEVYMTRSDGSCLNATSNGACLKARVAYAQSLGADLLVSIHADASTSDSSKGSLAIVAGNSGYRNDISQATRDAGTKIQAELTKLGLSSRGLYIRWSDSPGEEYRYDNGAIADWYSITRNSMKAGLPGIIIEHGFITNPDDATRFLGNEDTRKALGIADATGIADYFNLTKTSKVDNTLVDDSLELYTEDTVNVAGFISNLYQTALDRYPTRKEVSGWMQSVAKEHLTGGELAEKFIWSQEFQNKQLSNEEYVEKLYGVYLNRASDASGKNDWVNRLRSGASKAEIIRGFEESTEFHNICMQYGIAQTGDVTQNAKLYTTIADFVGDYYRGFLGREPDESGLETWVTLLVNGGTASDLTRGFVYSTEFTNSRLSGDQFVESLYNVYLNRESDAAGKAYWMEKLGTMSYEEKNTVINGFLYSEEYKNRCNEYGIEIGSL